MLENSEDKVAFHEIYGDAFLSKLYTRFIKHISEFNDVPFTDIIKDEIFIGNDLLNAKKMFANLEVEDMTIEDHYSFLEAHCYNFYIPKLILDNHEFTLIQKAHIGGYYMHEQMLDDEDYPHTFPEQQSKELKENTSEAFIETNFKWNTEESVKIYQRFQRERNEQHQNN